MRPVRLARIAAEAEIVRLRAILARTITRAVFALVALIFVLGALTFGHVAAWYEIRNDLQQSFLVTAGILGGVDLLIAIILGTFASRSAPSRAEVEAYAIRRKALEGIGSAMSVTQMAMPLVRLASSVGRRRRA